jgi:small GTP-binding protein
VYKIILIGDSNVGKTSIRKRYLGEGFEKRYMTTLGADFAIKRMGDNVLQIWDLAGQSIYKNVRSGYYKGAEGVIIAFDISRITTFENISNWIDELHTQRDTTIPMILVGNKADLRSDSISCVDNDAAIIYSEELTNWSGYKVPYVESSALTGENIDSIFYQLIEEMKTAKLMQEGK